MTSPSRWIPVLATAVAASICSATGKAQAKGPVNASAMPSGEATELAKRGARKLLCLAVVHEDWVLLYKWLRIVAAAETGRIAKKRLAGDSASAGAVTLPDTSSGDPWTGTAPRSDCWTRANGNAIVLNQDKLSRVWNEATQQYDYTFMQAPGLAGELVAGAALAHEVTHENDEYEEKRDPNGEATMTDEHKKKRAAEEVKGACCELMILNAFKAGQCLTPAQAAATKKKVCDRIKDVEDFKKKKKEEAK